MVSELPSSLGTVSVHVGNSPKNFSPADVVACIMAGLPDDIPRSRKQVHTQHTLTHSLTLTQRIYTYALPLLFSQQIVKELVSQELVGSSKELTKKAPKKKSVSMYVTLGCRQAVCLFYGGCPLVRECPLSEVPLYLVRGNGLKRKRRS